VYILGIFDIVAAEGSVFDQNKMNEMTVINHMNNIDKHLEFKILEEVNNSINYLYLSIHRNTNSIDLSIHISTKMQYLQQCLHRTIR